MPRKLVDFVVECSTFFQILNVCGRVVPQRSPLPGLQGVKISASEGTVTVLATDLEVFVSASAPAVVASPGEAVVPFKTLFSLVRLFPEGEEVAFAGQDSGWMRVRCGSSDTVLAGFPPDEFPSPPDSNVGGAKRGTESEILQTFPRFPAEKSRKPASLHRLHRGYTRKKPANPRRYTGYTGYT